MLIDFFREDLRKMIERRIDLELEVAPYQSLGVLFLHILIHYINI